MTDRFKDWVPVVPGRGELRETASALLAIAGDRALVRTEGNGTEFLVPVWVAEKFTAPEPIDPPEPPRRRSRAKKSEENA